MPTQGGGTNRAASLISTKLYLEKKEMKKAMMKEADDRKRKLLEDAQAFRIKMEMDKIALKRELEKQRMEVEMKKINTIKKIFAEKSTP